MKPYLLIAGYNYYPESGTNDWIDTFETLELLNSEIQPSKNEGCYENSVKIRGQVYDWHDIVDLRDWINR